MAVLAEVAGGSNNDIESIDTSLDGNLGVVEVASHVGEDLGLELTRSQRLMKSGFSRMEVEHTPSLQIASQSLLDCSEAAGLVNSMSGRWSALQNCTWRCAAEMKHTINTEVIKRPRNLDFSLEVEVGISKLLALAECALC